MSQDHPNLTVHRLLDAFLAAPGLPALEAVIRWLLEASPEPHGAEVPRTQRLAALAEVMRQHPRQEELHERLRAVWSHGSTVRLLAETGQPVHATLLKEVTNRLIDRLVPRLEPEDDLYVLLGQLRLSDADAAWLAGLQPEALAPWRVMLALPARSVLVAARLVARRSAAVGLAREMLDLTPGRPEGDSPFFRVGALVDGVVVEPTSPERWQAWLSGLEACRAELARAHEQLEIRGVSTDLIYRLELLETLLIRLDDLLLVATGRRDGHLLASELVRSSGATRGVRSLARTALKRLARKVTEHTAETGEHYVAATRREWEIIGVSALWGGVIAGLTAAVKFAITAVPFPPMLLGLAISLNYAISFVAMQLLGFTLASRQPSMTAAALAASLENRAHLDRQVELVAGITRSQVIATIGNVLMAIPLGFVLASLSFLIADRPPIGSSTALYVVRGLHPLLSPTVPFAALTGVLLWLASLAAGWAANGSAYRGLPQALARQPQLVQLLGGERARRLGDLVERHLSGVVGYVTLGFLMGFVPVLFSLVGLPVTVPHVSLNSGGFAIAVGTLLGDPAPVPWRLLAWDALSIALIGFMNIAVSFALALRTAMRARDLGRAERARLWQAIRDAFRAKPSRFLWRPGAEAAVSH